jgi:hypothetical protein
MMASLGPLVRSKLYCDSSDQIPPFRVQSSIEITYMVPSSWDRLSSKILHHEDAIDRHCLGGAATTWAHHLLRSSLSGGTQPESSNSARGIL